MNKKIIFLLLIGLLVVDIAYGQCAMCKKVAGDASTAGENDTSIGEQLNSGILYLMAIPYVVLFILFRKKIFGFLKELKSAGR